MMYKNSWYDAYENFSIWCRDYELTIEDVRERVIVMFRCNNWSPVYWNEMQYWCVLFYGKPIFDPYPEDQPSLLW